MKLVLVVKTTTSTTPFPLLFQLQESVRRLKATKADEDALKETRDELVQRLRMLEDVTACGQKVPNMSAHVSFMSEG